MKVIVTHKSPDIDAIASVWLIKRFLNGWQEAGIEYVPAGERLEGVYSATGDYIEVLNSNQIIHVDTGLGKLDHHQIASNTVCGASLTYEYIKTTQANGITTNDIKTQALNEIISLVVDEDHFQEVYYEKKVLQMYDYSFIKLLDGFKLKFPQEDSGCLEFGMKILDVLLQALENKLWAAHEINDKGVEFDTKYGKGLGVETINDAVLEVAQSMGYIIVFRKDPIRGYIRIKTQPNRRYDSPFSKDNSSNPEKNVDLTPIYERVKEVDKDASWYLHVSKKMLLNGSSKNLNMEGSKITVKKLITILKKI